MLLPAAAQCLHELVLTEPAVTFSCQGPQGSTPPRMLALHLRCTKRSHGPAGLGTQQWSQQSVPHATLC